MVAIDKTVLPSAVPQNYPQALEKLLGRSLRCSSPLMCYNIGISISPFHAISMQKYPISHMNLTFSFVIGIEIYLPISF